MTRQQQAHAFLLKYRNVVSGPPPIVRALSDEELRADLNEGQRVGAAFQPNTSEGAIVGGVIPGWLSQELMIREFRRAHPALG